MKAQVIKYSYIEHENDLDQGFRAWNRTKVAIVIPELNVLVVDWKGKVHFFLMKGFDDKFVLDYYPVNTDIKLPWEYEVIREIQVADRIANWARNFVDLLNDEIREMHAKWKNELRQASAG